VPDGVAVFDALHRRGTVSEAMLYCFDLLELNGEDLRSLPLGDREKRLARLLGRRRIGIVFSEHTDQDGALLFVHACRMGLEGIVSKRLSARPVEGLDQDQEPRQPGDESGRGKRSGDSSLSPGLLSRRTDHLARDGGRVFPWRQRRIGQL
jgi:hypothetical protein